MPDPKPMAFTRASRKHRIGRRHARAALAFAGDPTVVPADGDRDERLVWIAPDDRGVELEIVAVVRPDVWLVIHVIPTQLNNTVGRYITEGDTE